MGIKDDSGYTRTTPPIEWSKRETTLLYCVEWLPALAPNSIHNAAILYGTHKLYMKVRLSYPGFKTSQSQTTTGEPFVRAFLFKYPEQLVHEYNIGSPRLSNIE